MDADLFDLMSSMLERRHVLCRHLSRTSSEEEPTTSWRVRDDGTYDNRPSDPDYFQNILPKKGKTTC